MKPKSNVKKKVKRYWAVMPSHKECFSLIYASKEGYFVQAIFSNKTTAEYYKKELYSNAKAVDVKSTKLLVVPVTFNL